MYEFEYHQPADLDEAARVLADRPDAKPVAGGMSLLPTLKLRLAQVSDLVDLSKVGIKGIKREGDALVIGAMTRHVEVSTSEEVKRAIPALSVLAGGIGDPMVRNRGTMGGSIANADPAADYPSAVLGLGATVITNKRKIAADDFFKGLFETALEPGEIIIAVNYPVPRKAAYVKYPNPASRFAVVGVFVAQTAMGVRVAVTGAGPCVFRLKDAEAALSNEFSPKAVENFSIAPDGLNTDIHVTAEYRAHAIAVMLKRAVEQAAA